VNIDDIIREIDERYSKVIEGLVYLQGEFARWGHDVEVARFGGKIEGYKEMRRHATDAVHLAATGGAKSLERRVAEGVES
jgi:hypothetical protein